MSRRHAPNSARASNAPSSLSGITSTFFSSLYARNASKRVLKSSKSLGSKVHADNSSPSSPSRRSRPRTGGRSVDADLDAKLSRISSRSKREGSDAVAAEHQGDASGALHTLRPPSLRHVRDFSSKGSFRSKAYQGSTGDFALIDDDIEGEEDGDAEEEDGGLRREALAAEEQDEVAYFSQRGTNFNLTVNHRFVLHPHGRARAVWDGTMLLLLTWMLFTTPFELCFRELKHRTRQLILQVDKLLDVMFAIDIILNFMTAVEFDGTLHFSFRSISRHYTSGWFLLDLLCTLPFYALSSETGENMPEFLSLIELFHSHPYPLLRAWRLCRVLSLFRIRGRLEYSLRLSSSSSSLASFLFTVMGLSHLLSCVFAYLAFGDVQHLELAMNDGVLERNTIETKYIAASYWSMMTITTVGYGDLTVKTNTGRIFSIVAMATGGGIFAYGISNVVDLIQQLSIEEMKHRHKMDQVNTFMHDRNLPRKLRDEVRANFFHLRKATRENKVGDQAIVKQMSRTIQARVADLFCMEMMPERMPTLAGCNAEFIHDLYLAMEVKCYLPGEEIIRQDDYGTEMYFLFVGHVQVFVGHTRVAMFGPNSCFGEFAILNPRKPRLATIQAMDFCETHSVDRQLLLTILLRHPFVMQSIKQLVQLRSRKALSQIFESNTKARTLLQSLAAVWHISGIQGLLPDGVKLEDSPHLQELAANQRLSSVRTGLVGSSTGTMHAGRRKSITPAALEYNIMDATVATLGGGEMSRRRQSVHDAALGMEDSSHGSNQARLRRMMTKNLDAVIQPPNTETPMPPSEERLTDMLRQMQTMLKKQETLQQIVQDLAIARQAPPSAVPSDDSRVLPFHTDRQQSRRDDAQMNHSESPV